MYKYSQTSLKRLKTCDKRLQRIMHDLIKVMDVKILEGYRGKIKQDKAYKDGKSQLKFPKSKHNQKPSLAVDVAPYPINWDDISQFERMCGIIEGIALKHNIKIKLGRDWSFKDYPHIELDE